MNVTSAVRDSRVALPIMPKAPFSVNVAAPCAASAKLPSSPPPIQAFEGRLQRGSSGASQTTLDSRSLTKMSGE